jgi:hypothetical protein
VIDRIGLSLTKSGAGSSVPFAAPPRSRKCLTAIDNCQAERPAARRLPATKKSQWRLACLRTRASLYYRALLKAGTAEADDRTWPACEK